MKVVYEGKTNNLVEREGKLFLQFKDTVLGDDQRRVDPGGDLVVGRVPGKGVASASCATYFFEVLKKGKIPTHYVRRHSEIELEIRKAEPIRLEVVHRTLAYGSFLRRYRRHVRPLSKLDVVEFNMKDDILRDPPIGGDAIVKLRIANAGEVARMEVLARAISRNVSKALSKHGLKLVDMKVEFGRIGKKLVMIDSVSGDTMRVMNPQENRILDQIELAKKVCAAR